MKYKLAKNCEYIFDNDNIIVLNKQTKTKIILKEDCFKDLFKWLFIENVTDLEIIRKLSKLNNVDDLEARALFNSFIYEFINRKMAVFINRKLYKSKIIYLHSCLMELTNSCNLRCPHCYVDKDKTQYIDFDTAKEFINELKDLNCNFITLTGGEIMTYKYFKEIYKYLYDSGFIVCLNTNGSLIDDEIFELFKKRPPCKIEISLYGYNQKSYFEFTNNQTAYDNVLNNISKLKDLKINLTLKNVITNKNKGYFSQIGVLSKQLGCQFRSDYISFPQINKHQTVNPEQISVEETLEYLSNFDTMKEIYLTKYSQNIHKSNKVFQCKKNDDTIFIDSSGNISMCLCMQSHSIPYKNGNLAEIILDLRKFKELVFDKNSKCRKCNLKPLCRYCPGKFEMSTQNFQVPPNWFCELGKKIYEKYIKGYSILRKTYLSKTEGQLAFKIIKDNMIDLGYNITNSDKKIWLGNLNKNLLNPDFYFYLVYKDGKIVSFVELVKNKDKLTLSEIQINQNNKKTRLLLYIIHSLIANKELLGFDEVFFNINKNNDMSRKTFTHLGGEIVEEHERSCLYKISRKKIENYLSLLTIKSIK